MKTRLIAAAAAVALAGVAAPATASAAVRTLSIQDPQGDASALSGPVLDLKALDMRYDDDAGTLRVVWTYYNNVRAPEPANTGGTFTANTPLLPNVPNDSVYVNWWGSMLWDN